MLVLVFMDMVKMVVIIAASFKLVMPVIVVNVSSLIVRTMLGVRRFMPMMFKSMSARAVYVTSVLSIILAVLSIIPKMIFPPIVYRIKKSLLV